MKNIDFFLSTLSHWYAKNQRSLPFRGIKDPYKIWVSEIFLQQTQMSRGVDFYNRFIKCFPTIQSFAKSTWEEFLPYFEGLGYYNRGRNMLKAARVIMEDYKGKFPKEYSALIKIPGIGPYTANALLSFAFDEPVIPLDTNVKRLLGRVFLGISKLDENTKEGKKVLQQVRKAYTQSSRHSERRELKRNEEVESSHVTYSSSRFLHSAIATVEMTEEFSSSKINQAMMDFCSAVCFQTKPDCLQCCFQKQCLYFKKEKPHIVALKKITRNKYTSKFPIALVWQTRSAKKLEVSEIPLPKKWKKTFYKPSSAKNMPVCIGGALLKGDERAFLKKLVKQKTGLTISVRPAYKKVMQKTIQISLHQCYVLSGEKDKNSDVKNS